MKYFSENVTDTVNIGSQLVKEKGETRLWLLSGELGAGKTQLVKGMAQELGIDPGRVVSPTYTLVHEYQHRKGRLVHVDLYRLKTEGEVIALGLAEYLNDPDTLLVVEWPRLLAESLKKIAISIDIEVNGEGKRNIEVS